MTKGGGRHDLPPPVMSRDEPVAHWRTHKGKPQQGVKPRWREPMMVGTVAFRVRLQSTSVAQCLSPHTDLVNVAWSGFATACPPVQPSCQGDGV